MDRLARCAMMFMMLWATIAHAQSIGSTSGISNATASSASFTGPLDIASGSAACWSLRACSAALRGTKAINVCDVTGGTNNGCVDLVTDAVSGNLVTRIVGSTPVTCPGTNCGIATMYDQPGTACSGACNVIQATVAAMPLLQANCVNVRPCAVCAPSAPSRLAKASTTLSFTQPWSHTGYANRTGNTTSFSGLLGLSDFSLNIGWFNTVNTYSGATNATAADNAWHAFADVYDGASSSTTVDANAANTGTTAAVWSNSVAMGLCAYNTFAGDFTENVVYGSNIAAKVAALNANMAAYWGSAPTTGTYTGLGASRGGNFASFLNPTPKQSMSRTIHRATVNYGSSNPLTVEFGNWYINQGSGFAESGPGSTSTDSWGVEYPLNNTSCVAGTFSGGATVTISNGGSVQTDPLGTVTIPEGSYFGIRHWRSATSGVIYNDGNDLNSGEAMTTGVTVTDQTSSCGAVTSTASTFNLFPNAVIGQVSVGQPSVFIAGDSRVHGPPAADTYSNDTFGDVGEVARSLGAAGPNWGYVNGGVGGDAVANYQFGNYAKRMAIAIAWSTSLITQTGTNDFYANGASAATVIADWQNIWPLYTGKVIYATTIPPETTTTDPACTVVADQTPGSGNGARVTFNTGLRAATITGITGFFEVAGSVESSLNSGVWAAPGGVAITADSPCVHENYAGDQLILTGGGIITSKLK